LNVPTLCKLLLADLRLFRFGVVQDLRGIVISPLNAYFFVFLSRASVASGSRIAFLWNCRFELV
jgi:hypothetical protein